MPERPIGGVRFDPGVCAAGRTVGHGAHGIPGKNVGGENHDQRGPGLLPETGKAEQDDCPGDRHTGNEQDEGHDGLANAEGDLAELGRIGIQGKMSPRFVMIVEVIGEKPNQMGLDERPTTD